VIDRKSLARALARERALADWVLVERATEVVSVDDTRRREFRQAWSVIVHVDTSQGRGSARVDLGAADGTADDVVVQALALANAAIGPGWASVPQAAPAKMKLVDPALESGDLVEAATKLLHGIRAPADVKLTAGIELSREHAAVQSKSGFRTEWSSTLLRATALVASGERSLEIVREARHSAGLELDAAIAIAAADLALYATAGKPASGKCAVVLDTDAMLHGDGLGVWAAFAAQADAVVERQGLTRYREGTPIAGGADQIAEPLTISSNGALDWGVRSAPVGDEGDAIRKFTIIDRGTCSGLGLSPREAALRRRDPNGSVRNLEVGAGTWRGEPGAGRVVEIRRLRSLSIDRYTGDASLEIALGVEKGAAFSGGTVRLDRLAALARASRPPTPVHRGPYVGPASVMIDNAEIVA
jgi:predicted Zn-dependent protease